MTSITIGTPKRTMKTKWYLAAACGATLALAAGVGIWQGTREHHTATTTTPSQVVTAAPATVASDATRGGSAAAVPFTVYLTGSEEEAATLRHTIKVFTTRHGGEESAANELILIAATADEQARARQTIKSLRFDLGDGNVHIVDLRGQDRDARP